MNDAAGRRRAAIDGGLIALALLVGLFTAMSWWEASPLEPRWVLHLDLVAGLIGCLALWWRRRFPLVIAAGVVVLSTFAMSVTLAGFVALVTVAVHCTPRVIAVVTAANLLPFEIFLALRPGPTTSWPTAPGMTLFALQVAVVLCVVVWGLLLRSRRQLVASLRDRAAAAEVEAQLRAERSQHEAREALAREMHDVLGHRLSLLSVHAGALTYYRDASPEEITRASEVVRENAHRALQDLREVIGVLRAPVGELPLPRVEDVAELIDEAAHAGTPVELRDDSGATTGERDVPATTGRTLYRLVQECLTNARKHAPGAAVTIRITGVPGDHLAVEITNERPSARPTGSGEGLRGLAERAVLVGGSLEHGPTGTGEWRVGMRLPWPV
ncbi:histidine kinase [Saccharopolyspora indica]|uniref:sensor histidine kinase n=1 Tax=Saccharopolyspora indica TaxID=1229659 RepID=UPI0022EA60A6|nr:histidine kinase [Saccharopolyspora indica]MDA3646317.1 histidine kinase [Saccharopolyspora indica]